MEPVAWLDAVDRAVNGWYNHPGKSYFEPALAMHCITAYDQGTDA